MNKYMFKVNDQKKLSLSMTLNKYLRTVYRKIIFQSCQNNMLLSKNILPHDHIWLGTMNQQLNETNFLLTEFHVLHKAPRQNQ